MNPATQKQNLKLEQFREELKELEARYQYRLTAILTFQPNGIFPRLQVSDVIPPKATKPQEAPTTPPQTTTPAAPAATTPAAPEATAVTEPAHTVSLDNKDNQSKE